MLLTVACVASALLFAVSGGRDELQPPTGRHESLSQCPDDPTSQPSVFVTDSSRFLVIVSTLDGRVTALNGVSGVEQWSLNTGTTPLLSSSISKLEMMRGDKAVHLVPSLDGGLYQFDGDGIEPVPLGADLLLSTSFRFTDDSTIVGGKEIETYGIDLNSGKVRYVCSTAGCKYFEGFSDNLDDTLYDNDLLVIKRSTKTVRAVELLTGIEKWNFSVGQNDVSYISRSLPTTYDLVQDQTSSTAAESGGKKIPDMSEEDTNILKTHVKEEIINPWMPIETENEVCDDCDVQTEDAEEYLDGNGSSMGWSEMPNVGVDGIDVKVIVPSGRVIATGQNNPSIVHWQRKFSSSVAAAWVLNNQQLSELSLVDNHNIPVIEDLDMETSCSNNQEHGDSNPRNSDVLGPLLYIGAFEGQIYVQQLTNGNGEMSVPVTTAVSSGSVNVPHIRWRPYIATAPSRTPSASVPRNRLPRSESSDLSTAVIQWHEQYPFDEGFYLFPDYTSVEQLHMLPGNQTVPPSNQYSDRSVTMRTWWAVVVVSVVLSVCLNILVFKCIMSRAFRSAARISESQPNTSVTEDNKSMSVVKEEITASTASLEDNNRPPEYISRYLSDFTQEACLGRGGFGVVFRVRNQLDDCVYAVKRIALHDSSRAREKVTREVKALAKLEHPGIVRYYQSWFENPPPGWQEERDKLLCDSSVTTPTSGFSPVEGTFSCMKTEQKLMDLKLTYPLKRLESLNSSDLLSSYDLNHSVSGSGDTSKPGNSSSSDETADCSLSDQSESLHEISPMKDSGTENDSFEISFRDDDSSSVPTVNCSDQSEKLRDHSLADDSSYVVFENSAKPQDNIGERPRSQSQNKNVEKASKNRRPATLEILSKNEDEDGALKGKMPTVSKLYLYIQMQLCQSQNLKDWLNDNTLNRDKRQLLDIFHQMSSAINYVHSSGMMHRDLKPSNIFFAMDGSIKIGDFGLVTAVEETCRDDVSAESTPASGDRLHTDQVGTKLYMSPEQQRSARNYTHKVDIYALGMIFFELFYPFATEMERVKTLLDVRQMTFPPRFIRELADEASFVRPLLSHDPEARPSAKEILQHPIVKDFEEASQAYQRLHSQSRYRTMSNSSGNSTSTSEGSVPNIPA